MPKDVKKGWKNISDEQRDELLARYDNGEVADELSKLALDAYEVKIPSGTLARRLREWRSFRSGIDKTKRGVKISGDINNLEVSVVSDRIRTLDELIEAAKVDLDVWEVSHFIVNTYESFRKAIRKELSFDEGTIDGYVRDMGGVNIVPLYQVKAWLVRKKPIILVPTIQPITFKGISLPSKPKAVPNRQIWRMVVLPDPQFGFRRVGPYDPRLISFHDRDALDVALQITQAIQPDEMAFLGDVMDFPDLSEKFIKEVEFTNLLLPSLMEAGWWLAQFRIAAPDAIGIYLEGNHERRIYTSTVNNMRAMYGVRKINFGGVRKELVTLADDPVYSVPNLLSLDQLNIDYIEGYPDGRYWLNKALRIEHGRVARGEHQSTVKATVKDRSESVIMGHIHRIEMATKTLYERDSTRPVTAFSPGCLCKIDGTVPGSGKNSQWQHGMAVIEYEPKGTYFNIIPIFINNGEAIYNGQFYTARDRLPDIRSDIDHESALQFV